MARSAKRSGNSETKKGSHEAHENVLKYAPLSALKPHALDLN